MTSTSPLRATGLLMMTTLGMAPVVGGALYAWGGVGVTLSAGLGAALATSSAVVGLWLMSWALAKPQAVFLGALVGGILGRLFVFSLALALLVSVTELSPAAFLGGLFVYYAVCQALEIRTLHRAGRAVTPELEGER